MKKTSEQGKTRKIGRIHKHPTQKKKRANKHQTRKIFISKKERERGEKIKGCNL
jgi:hypothetical protein